MTGVGRGFGALLLAAVAASSVSGIVTITRTPVLTTRSGEALTAAEISRVRNVAGIEIPPAYFLRFPEFRAVAAERQWWTLQREVANALTGHSSVVAALEGPDGQRHRQTLRVTYPNIYQAIESSWLIYLAVLLYCVIAWSVYSKHKTAAGTVLGLFCLSCALYCATSAPIVGRGLVVPFPQFRWLMDINYVADSGLLTVVHFALLFPERKPVLDRWPVVWVIYGYFAAVNILYLSGFTAYDASLPFLYVWSFILFLAFVHSMVRETDPFLRRQVLVSIAVPALVAIIFIVFNADPSALGTSSTRFATFVIFALLMPFALMSAMDNILLYRQRLAAEAQSHQEREKVRQALHDDTLNKLANIALLSETTLQLLGGNEPQVRDKLQSIKQQATGYSQTIRQLLCVTDRRYGSWEDFSSLLRSYGYDATSDRDVAFDLAFTREPGTDGRAQLSTALTVTLYHIFVEALANALRHANPRSIHARLHLDGDRVSLLVTDDGDGFQGGEIRPGHYGVGNMTERARAMNGVLSIDSRPGAGTRIEATLPLGDTPGN